MPDGTEYDFGTAKATIVEPLSQVERDIAVASFVTTEMISRVGAGKVGEFALCYEIREG
jgi:hypothetical protein